MNFKEIYILNAWKFLTHDIHMNFFIDNATVLKLKCPAKENNWMNNFTKTKEKRKTLFYEVFESKHLGLYFFKSAFTEHNFVIWFNLM